MAGDLSGCVAVVTGASRGLGCEIALTLAKAKAEVALIGRDRAGLERTASRLRDATGRQGLVVRADVTSLEDVARAHAETEARFGRASILVNAAAVFGPLARSRRPTRPSGSRH